MKPKTGFYGRCGKRLLDIFLSALGLLLLSPILLILAILVRVFLGSPVLFRQERPGKDGNIFRLIKFRTMTDTRDSQGNLLPDSERLTKFGAFLRSTSLDELPELFNILSGHMSLVGPRSLLVKYLPLYTERQRRRHDVRPGLTGWAQVHGRNALSWEERFELDLWYVEHMSFRTDLSILLQTVSCVLHRDGISGTESVTMKEFTGTKEEAHV